MKVASFVSCLLLLSGCVSLSASIYGTKSLNMDVSTITIENGYRGAEIVQTCKKSLITTDSLHALLGEPDDVSKNGDITVLKYQTQWEWSGLMLMGYFFIIPVPIPLLLPVGESGFVFYANADGEVFKIEKTQRYEYFSTGFFLGETNEGGAGYYSGSWFGKSPKEVNGWVGITNDLWIPYAKGYYADCVKIKPQK